MFPSSRSLARTGIVAAWLAIPVAAQLPQSQVQVAGLGAIVGSFDAQTPTGSSLCLGVAYLDGEYYVTSGGGGAVNRVNVLDKYGTLLRQFAQNSATTFGYRDGESDGSSVMFGCEAGVYVHDPLGNTVTTVMADNGPQAVASPIAGPGLSVVGLYRALAYNPSGNGGNGSLWTASFGSALIEIDLAGNVLTNLPNGPGWSIYGLAWDPHTQTLLCNSYPNAGDIAQIDPTTGAIGRIIPRTNPGSAQGGLSVVSYDDGDAWCVAGLDQATPDTVTTYRVHMYQHPLRNGYDEGRLLTAVGAGPLDATAFKTISPGGTFSLMVESLPGQPRRPAFFYVNQGADALINSATQLGASGLYIPEFVALHRLSTPPGIAQTSWGATGTTKTLPVPATLNDGDLVRVQALTINPYGLAARTATNQMFFRFDAARILVEAQGTNSFNAVTTSGFFRVEHRFGSPIASVVFDWAGSSNPAQATMRFDTNQSGMADVFDAGNSTVTGCLGTYRNGSDDATGLMYDGLTTPPVSACAVAAGANTGFIGSNFTGSSGDYRTLEFRFAPGAFTGTRLELDVDTDGGAGVAGDDMAGMVVIVTLQDGSVLMGELAVDPGTPDRSFVKFL